MMAALFAPYNQHPDLAASWPSHTEFIMYHCTFTKTGKTFGLLVLAALFAGCASGPNIRSDYDKSVDFGNYKTYGFYDDAGPENTEYQGMFSKYVTAAIKVEMDKRGYVESANPDLLVNFNANLQEKIKVTSSPSPSMTMGAGYYGYRGGYYSPWVGYGYGTETNVSQYTEGTFNIDLVDAKANKLVWEAVGIGKVTAKKMNALEETVNAAVPEYFAGFPFLAGRSEPVQ